ncbi:MAG: hypothetical protein ACHQRJ_10630 [Alphaproteobacteria bacterium]
MYRVRALHERPAPAAGQEMSPICLLSTSADLLPAASAPAAAEVAAAPRTYHAELIEGRGYRATLVIEATSQSAAAGEAARYAAALGYRCGRLKAGAGEGPAW